jgi:VanZ family protein
LFRRSISRRLLYWVLTLLWAGQIYHFSTAPYSSDASRSLLEHLLHLLHARISPPTISLLNLSVRKLSHLIEYCMFTLLLYRSLAREQPLLWRPHIAFLSTGIASFYAMGDELHQLFVPYRHAALSDCGIDFAGAALAMLLLYNCCRYFSPKAVPAPPLIETTPI